MITHITETKLHGVLIIHNKVHQDNRGYFLESFLKENFKEEFVQDNMSLSVGINVIRGLHYQLQHPQTKLVSVLNGQILDVVVDIQKDSPTFGQYITVLLNAFDGQSVFVPKGYAHGFKTLSRNNNVINYKTTDVYYPNDAYSVKWNDPDINIDWSFKDEDTNSTEFLNLIEISDKDKTAPCLKDIDRKNLPSLNML